LKSNFDLDEIKVLLSQFNGIKVVDDVKNNQYPMPIIAEKKDEVFVGRIRRDLSIENGLNLWVVADNIRKGAATNAIQIAEVILKEGVIS
jgi:aspartate-semialdehyde dehydrogenase